MSQILFLCPGPVEHRLVQPGACRPALCRSPRPALFPALGPLTRALLPKRVGCATSARKGRFSPDLCSPDIRNPPEKRPHNVMDKAKLHHPDAGTGSKDQAAVVTRFAPSPTGYLHIGGARTALFNWLYARARGGTFKLRIEDTDRKRSTPEAIEAIGEGLQWLGLDWDGDIVYQFARASRHQEIAEELLARGLAYHCYASPDELAEMRETARAEGRPPTYDRRWRERDASEAPAGVKPALRFKAPIEGETVVDDAVQGRVVFQNKELDDLVILRADGTPTYNLSVVVDDHDMGLSHVIRGVDHLTNAARQSLIYKALGWDIPQFAHVPLIHGADGAKLSKRHGALGVEAYRDMGYLPAALRNYLVRLGWSHGDDEIFSTDELLQWFDLDGIGKSAARFDFAKLKDLNGQYIRNSSDAELVRHLQVLLPHIDGGPDLLAKLEADGFKKITMAMAGLKERAKTLLELIDNSAYLSAERPLTLDAKAGKLLDREARAMLARLAGKLDDLDGWQKESIEAGLRDFAAASDLKLGKVAQPLRAALTGRTVSPPIFDVMHVLGRQETMLRLRDVTSDAATA